MPPIEKPSSVEDLTELISNVDQLEEWDDLVTRVRASFFQSSGWVVAWHKHLAGTPETIVARWRGSSGRLEALAAFSKVSERIHPRIPLSIPYWTIAGSGAGAADHLGFPMEPQRHDDIVVWLSSIPGSLVLRSLPAKTLCLPSSFRPISQESTFHIDLPSPGQSVVASKSTRKNLRAARKRLEALGVDFAQYSGDQITEGHLDTMFQLHAERFAEMQRRSFFTEERKDWLLDIVTSSSEFTSPLISVAEVDGRTIGVDFSFRWGSTLLNYQSGWSGDFAKHSLGLQLVTNAIEWAQQNGIKRFDFLRGSESFKQRFGAQESREVTYLRPEGFSGTSMNLKAFIRSHIR